MRIKLTYDNQTSEHAGAGGMFQIETVTNAETGEDLTDRVDVGLHFSDEDEGDDGLMDYLKQVFGDDVEVVREDPEDDPEWPYK